MIGVEKVVQNKLSNLQKEVGGQQKLDVAVVKNYLQQLYDGVKDKSSRDARHERTKNPQDGRTAALMASVQIALKSLGYTNGGVVDGYWGKNTARAVREFQQAVGIKTD
jgi:peptidoglycan hydrolase-like protein with peptidoglycan-binding domain